MKYYSDVMKKFFDTEKECVKAEEKFKKELAEKEAAELKLKEEKTARAKEVEAAYAAVQEAQKNYVELRNKFVEDYKSYHMTYSSISDYINDVFENQFKIF